MRPEDLNKGLSFNDILLLPTDESKIISRKDVDTSTKISKNITRKYPIISAPMDTISDIDTCIALNKIGATGVLHRFMPIEEQVEKAKKIKQETNFCAVAIGLQDYTKRIPAFIKARAKNKFDELPQLFVLDTANGSNILIKEFIEWYNNFIDSFHTRTDIIIGNTLTKASVSRAINLKADGVRHGIGGGAVCLTTDMTGIGCPSVTALYYGWKAIRNHELENKDIGLDNESISLLLDGGIRKPADLAKALVCGANAVICGSIFAGCKETPGKIIEKNGKQYKIFRGQASKAVVEEYNLWDGNPENLFVEGKETEVEYTGQSVTDVVYSYINGLRSAMTYLGYSSLKEDKMVGSLWTGSTLGIQI